MMRFNRTGFLSMICVCQLVVACASKSSGGQRGSQNPAQNGSSGQNGKIGPSTDTRSDIVFDSPKVLLDKVKVKGYHMLVRDGSKGYSGYCMASVEKPNLPSEMLASVDLNQGPCPQTIKMQTSQATMAYVCPVLTAPDGSVHQTILYSKLNVNDEVKDIKNVASEIVEGFCAQ